MNLSSRQHRISGLWIRERKRMHGVDACDLGQLKHSVLWAFQSPKWVLCPKQNGPFIQNCPPTACRTLAAMDSSFWLSTQEADLWCRIWGYDVQEKSCIPCERLEHHLVQGHGVEGMWGKGFPKAEEIPSGGIQYFPCFIVMLNLSLTLCMDLPIVPFWAQMVQPPVSPAVFLFSLTTVSGDEVSKLRLIPLQLAPQSFSFQRYMHKQLW